MKLEDIEEAILKLSPGDLAKFRLSFAEFDDRQWPRPEGS